MGGWGSTPVRLSSWKRGSYLQVSVTLSGPPRAARHAFCQRPLEQTAPPLSPGIPGSSSSAGTGGGKWGLHSQGLLPPLSPPPTSFPGLTISSEQLLHSW